MTLEELRIAKRRLDLSAKILDLPSAWKVCEGCGTLVATILPVCPVCRAYRFDRERQAVTSAARTLGSRPVATTLAFLPRGASTPIV